jgi:phosphopantetheinyl transferase
MPIYKKDKISCNTRFLVWQIDESEDWLHQDISLTDMCINRLITMKSSVHRKGFLSVRHLLKAFGYTPAALHYDAFGKPHLADGKFISITHSHNFAAIAVGDNPLGVDIEKERPKVQRIAPKFLHGSERMLEETDRFRTTQWCIKEAAYKAFGKKGLSFLHDIRTTQMDSEHPVAAVCINKQIIELKNWIYHWPQFSCAVALKTS